MRRILYYLFRSGQRVRLSDGERAQGRQRLVTLMAEVPVTVANAGGWRLRWWAACLRPVPVALALFSLIGATTVGAAAHALPGDTLYGVKVQFVEELGGWFAFSHEARGNLAVTRAQRRLKEAAQLAAGPGLTADAQIWVTAQLEAQARQTRQHASRLEAQGRTEAAARLGSRYEAVLEANERILTDIETTTEAITRAAVAADGPPLHQLIEHVRVQGQEAGEARSTSEAHLDDRAPAQVRDAALRQRAAAAAAIAKTRGGLDRQRAALDAGAAAAVEGFINQADQAFADGQEVFDAGAYGAAFARFQTAERFASSGQVKLEAFSRLRVEVRLPLRDSRALPKPAEVDAAPAAAGGEEAGAYLQDQGAASEPPADAPPEAGADASRGERPGRPERRDDGQPTEGGGIDVDVKGDVQLQLDAPLQLQLEGGAGPQSLDGSLAIW